MLVKNLLFRVYVEFQLYYQTVHGITEKLYKLIQNIDLIDIAAVSHAI